MFNIDLSIIAPCYNEEHNIHEFVSRLMKTLKKIDIEAEIILVNDGSKDDTEKVIQNMVNLHPTKVIGLKTKKIRELKYHGAMV